MKLDSEESIKILEMAQSRELATRDFYKNCLAKATIEGTKTILIGLVEDEDRHYAIVTSMLNEAKSNGSLESLDAGEIAETKVVFDNAFPEGGSVDDSFSAESVTVMEMLKTALAKEKGSFDLYSEGVQKSVDPEVVAIYKVLAEEEKRHYILIDNLINYLDNSGRWLYAEENQIFRL